jgi:adenosylcobinamide-phosphate synthase
VTTLALAIALDLLVGEPPNRWHPVAWIGALIARGRRLAPGRPVGLLLWGAVLILAVTGVTSGGALAAHAALAALPMPVALLGDAWLLKCSFSLGGLFAAVGVTRGHLVADDLVGARRQVSWHLVSRSTEELDAPRSPRPPSSPSLRTSPTAWYLRSATMRSAFFAAGPARASRSPGPTAW